VTLSVMFTRERLYSPSSTCVSHLQCATGDRALRDGLKRLLSYPHEVQGRHEQRRLVEAALVLVGADGHLVSVSVSRKAIVGLLVSSHPTGIESHGEVVGDATG